MTETNLRVVLADLGLSDTEARVYLAMLELGPESVQNIAKKARVSRTAAYEIIGSLQNKGIASTFQKGKKKFFSAEDPDRLFDYFKIRMENMKGQLGTFKRLVPELRLLQGEDKPKVRYYSGEEGVQALFRDLSSIRAKELLEIADADKVYEHVDPKVFIPLREAENIQNIPCKVLVHGVIKNPSRNCEYRKLPNVDEHFAGLIWIYENRVAFMKLVGGVEVVILESRVFAETMSTFFRAMWSVAKPLS